MTRSRHILRPRLRWTAETEQFLRDSWRRMGWSKVLEKLRASHVRVASPRAA